jgi:PAS domain S-box-containing protein
MSLPDARQQDVHYYQNLVHVVRDGIICTDLQGRISFVNKSLLAMLGYLPAELLGAPLAKIHVEEDRSRCCPRVIQETLDKGAYAGEFLFRRRDGSRFPGHLSSSWMEQEDGTKHLVFVIHDVSEQKRLQKSLLDSEKMASLGKMMEGISHEIRNPIMTLGGYARRLKRTLEPGHVGHAYLQIILEDVQRMEKMLQEVNDYVAFAEDHGRAFTKLDLQGVFRDALMTLEIPERVHIAETFPAQGPWIYGDPGRLRGMFAHLLENALEAMPEGGTLRVQVSRENSQVRVRIEDTGVGIAEDDLPHIFNPFFSTKPKSTGVGLAKVYSIVREHGGQIEVESRVNGGTTFTLSLPVDRRQSVRRNG